MILSLSLAAVLLAAPAQAKTGDAAAMQAEAASVEKAADSAAAAADAANKAATAAQKAAEAAASAAESAAKAADAILKVAQQPAAATTVVVTPAGTTVAGPPPTAAIPAVPDVTWTSVIDLGLISLTGNTQSIAFSLGGNIQRKGPDWIWGIKGSALYGEARDSTTGESTVNAEAAAVEARGDRRVSTIFSGYLLAGIMTDHIKSIEERPYGELGASLTWFDVKEGDLSKTSLRTDLGFRYGREYRYQYFPTPLPMDEVDIVAPHLGLAYRYALNKEIFFTNDLDLVANVEGSSRLLLTNNTKLAARLTASLNLTVSFLINYDSLPPPSKLSTDTALTVGVEVAL